MLWSRRLKGSLLWGVFGIWAGLCLRFGLLGLLWAAWGEQAALAVGVCVYPGEFW